MWWLLLGPLLIWTAHFFGIYLAAEFAPQTLGAIVPLLTVVGFAGILVCLAISWRQRSWSGTVVAGTSIITAVAMVWQAMPLYIG